MAPSASANHKHADAHGAGRPRRTPSKKVEFGRSMPEFVVCHFPARSACSRAIRVRVVVRRSRGTLRAFSGSPSGLRYQEATSVRLPVDAPQPRRQRATYLEDLAMAQPSLLVRVAAAILTGAIATACGGGSDDTVGPDPNVVTSVVIDPTSASLTAIGATQQFTASARNSNGGAVSGKSFSYTSSSPSVASVTGGGLVTSVGNGTTTITATLTGGTLSANATVTVAQTVSALTATPPTTTLLIGGTQQITVAATDSRGVAIASPSVGYTSSAETVATVSTSGLITAVALGTATITATSGTVSATVAVTVSLPDLTLTRDTTLSGTRSYRRITVPAGVTVTAGAALTLHSTGLTTIAGTITGNCVPVDIGSDTALVITGTIRNGCSAGTGGDLRLAANGELTLTDATVVSSGDITLTNDPTLTDASFPSSALLAREFSFGSQPGGVPFTRISRTTVSYHAGGTGPNPAANGTDGVNGGNAANGRTVKMFLRGNAVFDGGTLLWGQDGGRGGNGTNTASTNLAVTGGAGGNGGLIKVYITGSLTYQGSPTNTVRSGKGGAGGTATATTTTNAALSAAPSATSTGGAGGEPGLIDIRAGGGIVITGGALTLEVPAGGVGGDATSVAANGVNALVKDANSAAQPGGAATATGGKGGNTPNARLSASSVTGAPVLMVPGGGAGGIASATAGIGGMGVKPQKNGAVGGAIVATGGAGGNSQLRDLSNALLGSGGNGGNGIWRMGTGGGGWNDCVANNLEAGGNGGQGGSASGARGAAGTGLVNGTVGTTHFETVGNGGAAGSGAGPGVPGMAGVNSVALPIATKIDPIFSVGAPGTDCSPPPASSAYVAPESVINTNGVVATGSQNLNLTVDGVVRGSVPFIFQAPTFFGANPNRLGVGAGGRITIMVSQAQIDGQEFGVKAASFCLVNSSSVSAGNPVTVEEWPQGAAPTTSVQLTSPNACYQRNLQLTTIRLVIYIAASSFDLYLIRLFAQYLQ